MSFRVAIPSYKRAETLRMKTLSLLQRYAIDPKSITVFVANKDEEKLYRAALPKDMYGELVVGVLGIANQRNFMLDHFDDGEKILSIDDDIMNVSYAVKETNSLVECDDFSALVETGFAHCAKSGARLWGLYPVHNAYFMKPTISYDLKFVIGCLCGYINQRGESPLRVTLPDKDDVERTCRCYEADERVVRINYASAHQKYLKEPGGLQEIRTDEFIFDIVKRLLEMFPHFCTVNRAKKGGVADVVLRDRRVRQKVTLK